MTDPVTDLPASKEELAELLRTPLDPNLDYLDATASIEAISEHIRGLHKLVNFLAQTLVQQGASILELRQQAIEVRADLGAAGVERQDGKAKPAIIMPPKLRMN